MGLSLIQVKVGMNLWATPRYARSNVGAMTVEFVEIRYCRNARLMRKTAPVASMPLIMRFKTRRPAIGRLRWTSANYDLCGDGGLPLGVEGQAIGSMLAGFLDDGAGTLRKPRTKHADGWTFERPPRTACCPTQCVWRRTAAVTARRRR